MSERSRNTSIMAVTVSLMLVCALAVPAVCGEPDTLRDPEGCCCIGRVGNVDCDYADLVDIGDLIYMVDHLFINYPRLPNRDEANIDGDPERIVDISDLTALIAHLFITFAELPPCPSPPNHPPETRIRDFPGSPFINAVSPGSPITGVRMAWEGSDIVDHPYYPPPFEFEWRLYGPYFSDRLHDSTWEYLSSNFIKTVFLRNNGDVIHTGEGLSFVVCDTVPIPVGPDSISFLITCDTVLVDTISENNIHGMLNTVFDVDDPNFAGNPLFNRIAAQSLDPVEHDEWVWDVRDSIYDVFWDEPSDTTQEQYFVFWVRSRDPVDSNLYDPTPAFQRFSVIDARYQHDIGIIDCQLSFSINSRIRDSAKVFWERAVGNWASGAGIDTDFDVYRDYRVVTCLSGLCVTLRDMLAYKLLILLNDNPYPGVFINPGLYGDVFTAIDAGVNVWLAMRAPVFGGEGGPPYFDVFGLIRPALAESYAHYFGVEQKVYSGWEWHIYYGVVRIEDFIGAQSVNTDRWPDLVIDSSLLHRRYDWHSHFPWIDTLAALPEVNWFTPAAGTEPMFLYQSLYGSSHFLGLDYSFEGKPVAQRYETGYFRTAHWLFTPLAFEESSMQVVIDTVLNWLYDPNLGEPVRGLRYENAEVEVSLSETGERYWRRMIGTDSLETAAAEAAAGKEAEGHGAPAGREK